MLLDIGSTYTKVTVVDVQANRVVGRSAAPSTVGHGVQHGILEALGKLSGSPVDSLDEGFAPFKHRFACSSAAGGLRMVVIGLVDSLTVEAGRRTAFGAGAKVIKAFADHLGPGEVLQIEEISPDIILLTGGTDGGDRETILHNAGALAESRISCPVIVAGNRECSQEVSSLLRKGRKEARTAENVMPDLGKLNPASAGKEIRDVFFERITEAKGLEIVKRWIGNIIPTPMAVLQGAVLLNEGTDGTPGMGELIVLDVGGATTDVHSIARGKSNNPGTTVYQGLEEPFAKRTVEGDLGIRYNAGTILNQIGVGVVQEELSHFACGPDPVLDEELFRYAEFLSKRCDHLSSSPWQKQVEFAFASICLRTAFHRHAGRVIAELSPLMEVKSFTVVRGKDLRDVPHVIGTGGIFAYQQEEGAHLLRRCLERLDPAVLLPLNPALYIDSEYLLYGAGLLCEKFPEAAFAIAKNSLQRVGPDVM